MSPLFRQLGIEPPLAPAPEVLDAFWRRQQASLEATLAQKVPAGSTVALLDYPVHGNTGDHLIMLGTEQWATRQGLRVAGRWHADNFRYPCFPKDTILVCHGGGNLGDLYRYQRHREKIISAYPNHRIVVLPQTIHFRSRDRLRESARRMGCHADLHLFVRDRRSLELAQSEFAGCSPTLAADMAAFLFPFDRQLDCTLSRTVRREFFCLCRRDIERTNLALLPGLENARPIDWDDLAPMHRYLIWGLIAFVYAFGKVYSARWAARWWHDFCRERAIRAAREMAGAEYVVSNRLHAHILACLLGIPNLLFDNSYGKCSDYYRTWHSELAFARLVTA